MTNKVVHFNNIGNVIFSRNKRSKNIKISVKPDKTVRVSYPYFCSGKEVAGFLQKNEDWIRQQQLKFEIRKKRINAGDEINTKIHRILFVQSDKNWLKKKGKEIIFYCNSFKSDETQMLIENQLTKIYRFEAQSILPARVEKLAQIHRFQFNKVTIRNNKRNWGSCSSKNNISLNLQMMKLPDELIDYILLHELVHTEIKNHGPGFWQKLNEITDFKAKELAKEVRQFSTYTL